MNKKITWDGFKWVQKRKLLHIVSALIALMSVGRTADYSSEFKDQGNTKSTCLSGHA